MKPLTDRMCFACGEDNPISLKLKFESVSNEQVEAVFIPNKFHQGYAGIMHGGLVSTLLDEAMVKAINFNGIKAVTGELKVRFRHPVPLEKKLIINGLMLKKKSRLIFTEAFLKNEEGKILAQAEAKFMVVE